MNASSSKTLLKYSRLIALLAFSTAACANSVYKWTDDKGQVHFGQNPSTHYESELIYPKTLSFGQNTDNDRVQVDTTTTNDNEAEEELAQQDEAAPEVFKKDASLCSQAKESHRILMQHPIVRRQGKVLTMEEKNEELRNLAEIIRVHC